MFPILRSLLLPMSAALLAACANGDGTATPAPGLSSAIDGRSLATPQGKCGTGSRPETGRQGRVSQADHDSGAAAAGFQCNMEVVGSALIENAVGSVGGFRVERYVDAAGNECAYYDTTLMWPTNAFDVEAGVNVLDMSDPTSPVRSARLVSPGMLTPHESVRVNAARGLLIGATGNAGTYPGILDIYDLSQDCRNPTLVSSTPTGVLGHESGFAPDGNTVYIGSAGGQTLTAVDVSNPLFPVPLWVGKYSSHGLEISDDGNTAYVAAVGANGLSTAELLILDVSEIQARVPNPTVREISSVSWSPISIPQNAVPFTIKGHPYVMEVDEFGSGSEVGAARIIDVGDLNNPEVISNLRLQVHDPEHFSEQASDPGYEPAVIRGYAAHYCNIPSRVDPTIVACSMALSGLRVFDIRNPHQPVEVAYHIPPLNPRVTPGFGAGAWAMSSPAFVPERKEIWYSDAFNGFFALRVTNNVWK